jgi:hypothetical protein
VGHPPVAAISHRPTPAPERERTPARRRLRTALPALVLVLVTLGSLTGLVAPTSAAEHRRTTNPTPSATSGTTAPDSRTITVGPEFFGLHDGTTQAYDRVDFGSVRLWDAGVRWDQVEASPGVYRWTGLDALVSAAQAHHAQVTLVLAMTPSFAGPAANRAPTDLADYAAYVRAVMERYRDFHGSRGIAAYQVWNEGNIKLFWDDSPAQLARLTQVVDRVRDQVDPGATVVAPSFAVTTRWERRWLADYQAQKVDGTPVWQLYDANGFSLYPRATYADHAGGPEDAVALIGRVRRILAAAGVPDSMPMWATEVNYGLKAGGPQGADPISDRRQVANVLRTYLLGASRGLARVFWYRYDWGRLPESQGGGTLGNTLLAVPGQWDQVTPAGRALATAQDWLRGRLVAGDRRRPCAHDHRGTYTCLIRHAGGTRAIYWNPYRKVTVQVRGAVAMQDESGRRTPLADGTASVEVGYQPVMVQTR